MRTSIYALALALALSVMSTTGSFAADYEDHPDWASETFSDADDKGSP